MSQYIAIVAKQRKCPDCDAIDAGHFNRLDCGCIWEEEIGRYDTANAARLAAMAKARKRGTWGSGGRATGHWTVETEAEGTVEWSR